MRNFKAVLFIACLCIVVFQAREGRALFMDDIDPEEAARIVEQRREESRLRLEALKSEELKLKTQQEAIPREITEEVVAGPSPPVRIPESNRGFAGKVILTLMLVIFLGGIVFLFRLRKR